MKFKIALAILFMPSLALARGGIDFNPNPKALLSSTNTWTGSQTYYDSTTFLSPITVPSCIGCGGASGSNATLTSPATGPYNLNGVGAVINSTGVYLSSGSISIGSSPATALLEIDAPDGNQFIPLIISTPTGRIFEIDSSSVTFSTVSVLIQSTAGYSVPLVVGLGNSTTGDKPVAGSVIAMFGGNGTRNPTPRIVVRDHVQNTELELGAGTGLGLVGTFTNTDLNFRVGDSNNWDMNTTGDFILKESISGGRLIVGAPLRNGSRFQVFDGSMTSTGGNAGLVIASTSLVVYPGGGVSIGTNTLGLGGFFSSSTMRIEGNRNNNSILLITSSSLRIADISGSSVTFSNVPVRITTGSSGIGGGVDAATYTINGNNIFRSTWSAHACDGMTVIYDTGSIAANTTLTYSASQMGGTSICGPKAGMIEQVNTATAGPRIKSLNGLPSNFTIYNPDVTNTQGFWVEFWIK